MTRDQGDLTTGRDMSPSDDIPNEPRPFDPVEFAKFRADPKRQALVKRILDALPEAEPDMSAFADDDLIELRDCLDDELARRGIF